MNVQKYIKMILYKISVDHEVMLTTIEKYDDKNKYKYQRTIILNIDGNKEYFNNYYELLDFLTGYIGE